VLCLLVTEELHVGLDGAGELHRLTLYLVEIGLQVLERQREVQDVEVRRGRQGLADKRDDRTRAVDGAGGKRTFRMKLAREIPWISTPPSSGLVSSGLFMVVPLNSKGSIADQAMNGLTAARTVAMLAGLANAPSGVGVFISTSCKVAAWRASMVWIASAAARISALLMFPAWPR
jgi:hypothetical protein